MSPERRRLLKRALILTGGVVALVVLAGVGISIANSLRGPDVAVQAYLDRLAQGDAAGAAEQVDPGIPNDQRLLLSDEAVAAADHRLEVVSLRTDSSDREARVTATLAVDGEQFEHVFTVDRGPNELLVLNTWRVRDALISPIYVASDLTDEILLGDIVVPASVSQSSGDPLWIYPGTYTFTAAPNEFYDSVDATVRVLGPIGPESAYAHVAQSPSEALADLVLEKVQERVTACATVDTNLDDICPSAARRTDLVSLAVTRLPEELDELTLTTWTAGEAVITTQRKPAQYWDYDPQETAFHLSGSIEFVEGEPSVTFRSSGWW